MFRPSFSAVTAGSHLVPDQLSSSSGPAGIDIHVDTIVIDKLGVSKDFCIGFNLIRFRRRTQQRLSEKFEQFVVDLVVRHVGEVDTRTREVEGWSAGGVERARIRGKAGTESGDWLSKVALSINWSLRHVVFFFFVPLRKISTGSSQ
jgi:hypothetical protein